MCSVLHVYVLSGVMLLVEDLHVFSSTCLCPLWCNVVSRGCPSCVIVLHVYVLSGVMLLVEDLHVFSSTCLCPLWCNVVSRGPSCVQFYMFMSSLV